MSNVLATVAPVFGLIALGWLAAVTRLLSAEAARGVTAFVFTIAMPALLFRTLATVEIPSADTLGLLAGFMGATAITWVLATALAVWPLGRSGPDGASIAMAAGFGNTVMMGIPLVIGHYGEEALAPLAVVIAVHAPVLWLAATLQLEWTGRQQGSSLLAALGTMLRDLARNPIILGIVLGGLWRQTGLGIEPIVVDKIIGLLAQAGVPGALFALGMSLAQYQIRGQIASMTVATVLKLVATPVAAFALAEYVFALPPLWTGVIVLLAACPTGANAFLFASKYDRAVGTVSGAIALGTALSAITISALLLLLGDPGAAAARP